MNYDQIIDETESDTTQEEISRVFTDLGYRKLGSGVDATVWAKKGSSDVIKIIMPSDSSRMDSAEKTFRKFYEFCQANGDQPNLPKFVHITKQGHVEPFTVQGKNYIMIGMERLNPIKNGSISQALVWILSDLATKNIKWEQAYKQLLKSQTWKFWEGKPSVKEIVSNIKNFDDLTLGKIALLYTMMRLLYHKGRINKMGWDLHTENVMQRDDGTLVITDPWFQEKL